MVVRGFLRQSILPIFAGGSAAAVAAVAVLSFSSAALGAVGPVGLGTAKSFAVLAGTTVTNTGPSVISGSVGVSPGNAVTGFPPGEVINGSMHRADAVASDAESDLTTAYNDAAGRTPVTVVKANLGGRTLAPGVYKATSDMSLTGTVTLDGDGNPNSVFIFQASSTLITASSATVALTGDTQACNVFWQVGSSATLGTGTSFVGSVLALTSISVQTGTTVAGRVLARNGQVSLDDNVITEPSCSNGTTTTTTSPGSTTSTTTSGTSPRTPTNSTTTTTAGGHGSVTTTTLGGSKVPNAHTGEPWAGWQYWALTALAGLLGMTFTAGAIRIRRHL
ncbi:MAG: ice-binding family protein [Acidimicrobiales bacterium]|jgi:type VI secretion system secreted protein VgrG